VIGVNAEHVAMSEPVPPSALTTLVLCGLLGVEQPYRIPTIAPPSTVVIAHAVRIIVLPSCGIPPHARLHGAHQGPCELF
jgi:hypothetical protein